jgi:hypothetical protein
MPAHKDALYSEELAQAVLDSLSEGNSLRDTAKELGISPAVVRSWVVDNLNGFGERYTRARILQAEAWADEIITVAADGSKDTVIKYGRDGSEYEAPDNEWINRSRLIVDTKKWLLAKLHPATYGDKLALDNKHDVSDSLLKVLERIGENGGNR